LWHHLASFGWISSKVGYVGFVEVVAMLRRASTEAVGVINLNKTTLKQLNTSVEEVGLRVVELCSRLGVLINFWV